MSRIPIPALIQLADDTESHRRKMLRSHEESGVSRPSEMRFRNWVDADLDRLTRSELAVQTIGEARLHLSSSQESALKILAASPAFAQYLNVYTYFGVRFAIGRLLGLAQKPPFILVPSRNCNEPVPSLTPPPPIPLPASQSALSAFRRFIALNRSIEFRRAENFLDGFSTPNAHSFELWLKGLYSPGCTLEEDRLLAIARGMLEWARSRAAFYVGLEPPNSGTWCQNRNMLRWLSVGNCSVAPEWHWVEGCWRPTNPLTARFGVAELFWLARLLRAEISPNGTVRYNSRSWLWHLASKADGAPRFFGGSCVLQKGHIFQTEEILREVFGYACDLVQNSAEITANEREASTLQKPYKTVSWRIAGDEELVEIAKQRDQRQYGPGEMDSARKPMTDPIVAGAQERGWSLRICTGEDVSNLTGLAFSGGGIRSATFNLGVLQRLKSLDLLRKIDYLSTVSGGGYIGAWLVGNVRRTHHWLSKLSDWDSSVRHLRRYSNYLAPNHGLMSADSWTMWGTWLRNALLIQMTTAIWLAVLLVGVLTLYGPFTSIGASNITSWVLWVLLAVILSSVHDNLGDPVKERGVLRAPRTAAVIVWCASFLTASLLWNIAVEGNKEHGPQNYSMIVLDLLQEPGGLSWQRLIPFLVVLLGMASFAWRSANEDGPHPSQRVRVVAGTAIVSVVCLYFGLCAVVWTFSQFDCYLNAWYAYAFGPYLVILATCAAVVLFIGLLGRDAWEWTREWWTRFGAELGIIGTISLLLTLTAIFGPIWLDSILRSAGSLSWLTIAGWLGSVAGGLLAGNHTSTQGGKETKSHSPHLQIVAVVGAGAFIAGAMLTVALFLRFCLVVTFADGVVDTYWNIQDRIMQQVVWQVPVLGLILAAVAAVGALFSWRFELNVFSLNQFYRNRLVRCYLGATRWTSNMRSPHFFTGFDELDDIPMAHLAHDAISHTYTNEPYRGPFPVVNCTVNLGGASDLDVHTRHGAPFTVTPLRAGFPRSKGGYSPVHVTNPDPSYAGGVTLGQAISISGAAANPNMGFNTSPLVSFLLTMFNIRLGWWFPNPGAKKWHKQWIRFSLVQLIRELFGQADENKNFVNVSDGGHFENLGIYELVRRRVRVIIACDAECDSNLAFGSLGNVIRLCQTDFGAKIDIDIESIRRVNAQGVSRAHCAVGKIYYCNGSLGYLVYLKSSMTGDESPDIEQYRATHPSFPHETTADQFFSEDQFESYRRLGYHVTDHAFRAVDPQDDIFAIAARLFDLWPSIGSNPDAFSAHTKLLDDIWDRLRESPGLARLRGELVSGLAPQPGGPSEEELLFCNQIFQLMESVFLDLRLDDYWDHPDNRGWALLFVQWAKSPSLHAAWSRSRRTFGIRFEYFCEQRLGMEADHPVVRAS